LIDEELIPSRVGVINLKTIKNVQNNKSFDI
jgi:hypothetical protein